jgi:2-oxoglutarate/2-oxoacid ferredoxin oxidoreductase subunit alpha
MSGNTMVKELRKVTIRFTGDSGDGMQLAGMLFSDASALYGNNISTFPDFPSEIRAPQGTVSGVSGFQVHFGQSKIDTPGDYADVLVSMNPAALKISLQWLKKGGTIIVDIDSFAEKDLAKAGYITNPLEDGSLVDYQVIVAPITSQTQEILKDSGLDNKSINKTKNMFALGITYFMFDRPIEITEAYFEKKFKEKAGVAAANKKVLRGGYNFAGNVHAIERVIVPPAEIEKGFYRTVNGNQATAWGLLAAAEKANLQLFLGSYPITPASDILQELAKHKALGAHVVQCEDEIAGICTSIGASFTGNLAVTSTSGPGLSLKSEAIGLAVMMELPLVIVNVQRGGPSTGLPTKTEQSDLMQALYGRNGDCPCIVMAGLTSAGCFESAYMAAKLALEHMTPVILLTDGYIANGSQPWKIQKVSELPQIKTKRVTEKLGNHTPFMRAEDSLARNWVVPGQKDMMYRIGGLEKDYVTGAASHDSKNHEKMVKTREEKVKRVANYIPDIEVIGEQSGDLLVVGWGSTYGHLLSVVKKMQNEGHKVGLAQFAYINPLPKNTAEVFSRYKKIIVCELNLGQFVNYLRFSLQQFQYLQYNKIQGLPFTQEELKKEFSNILDTK